MTAPATLCGSCPLCLCEDCGGPMFRHEPTGCDCEACAPDPSLACTAFQLPIRIILIHQQLAPLLSAHLHNRADQRCWAAAHATHHALLNHDKENR